MVLAAKDDAWMAHDIPFPYRQDPNFFYLTGLLEPDAVAILVPCCTTPLSLTVGCVEQTGQDAHMTLLVRPVCRPESPQHCSLCRCALATRTASCGTGHAQG